MRHLIKSLLIFLFGIAPTVRAAANEKNHFINPTSHEVWSIGDVHTIEWITELKDVNVTFWQQSLTEDSASKDGNIYSKTQENEEVFSFDWAVQLYSFDLSKSNVFFFWVNPDGGDGFTSTFFNITDSPSTSTTAGSDGSSPTDAADDSTTSGNPSVRPDSSSQNSSDELDSSGKIALGVGIGVGIPILGALFGLLWLKFRQSKNNNQQGIAELHERTLERHEKDAAGRAVKQEFVPASATREIPGTNPRDYYPELPGTHHSELPGAHR
ncbi:hypothetical protein FQN54_004524 [Arachnomyces sp. PD_36]|nr:hypothetical protein FQN54_004524 [Arachnomyces sp. PD_36]